jgi:hypothetical protein
MTLYSLLTFYSVTAPIAKLSEAVGLWGGAGTIVERAELCQG